MRRSSSKIADSVALEKQELHHHLAMRVVVPLLVKNASHMHWTWTHLHGVQSRTPPPVFGKLCPVQNDYYDWSLAINRAVERGARSITLVIQSIVGWSSDAAGFRHWLRGAKNAGIHIRLLFWHSDADPSPTEEGRAWCDLYSPLRGGTLGWYLDLSGTDLLWADDRSAGPTAMAFDKFCGATGTGMMSEEPGIWQKPFCNTLTDQEVEVFQEELESREFLGF